MRGGLNNNPLEELTERTQDSEHGAGVSPATEQASKPKSPRATEPQHEITKRTREDNLLRLDPKAPNHEVVASASEGFEAERRTLVEDAPEPPTLKGLSPWKPAQENTKRTPAPPEPSRTGSENWSPCIRARAFLTADRQFHTVGDVRHFWGIQGLSLCLAYAAAGEEAHWLWVIVGDLPPAHIPTGSCPNAEEALGDYAEELRAWLEAAKQGEPSNEYIPMLHPVTFKRLKPTAEARTFIENRARFIDEQIIQTHRDELRAIGVHGPSTC